MCGEVGVVRWYGGGYILWVVELTGWGGEGLVRVVGVGELCIDASAFAEATVDKRCRILDARKMTGSEG